MAQSIFESSPQLALQVFVVLTENAWPNNKHQMMSMILSTVMMSYPETEKYLIQLQPYNFFSVIKFLPVFMANIAFRALSWSVLFRFFDFFYSVIIMVIQGLVLALIGILTAKFRHPELPAEENFKGLLGEMALLHCLTVPCLKNTPASRYLRKFSFYAGLIVNTVLLLAILWVCNMRIQVHFPCRPIFQDCLLSWQDYAVVQDIATLNIYVSSVIGLGLVSVLLDKIYSRVARPVFNVFEKTSCGPTGPLLETPSNPLQRKESPFKQVLGTETPSKEFLRPAIPSKQLLRTESPSKQIMRTESPSKQFFRPAIPSKQVLRAESPSKQLLRTESPSKQIMRPAIPSKHKQIMRAESPAKEFLRTESPSKEFFRPASPSKQFLRTESIAKEFLRPAILPNHLLRTESPSKVFLRPAIPSKQLQRTESPSNHSHRTASPSILRKAIFKH